MKTEQRSEDVKSLNSKDTKLRDEISRMKIIRDSSVEELNDIQDMYQ